MEYKKLIASLKAGILPEVEQELRLGDKLSISRLQHLRAEYPELPLSDLLNHYKLQKRGKVKFSRADEMVFTAKGVEQCSSEIMGKYHNRRAGKVTSIADLCCGIGGDLQYLADNRKRVYAVDLDEDSLLCARYNCQDRGNIIYLPERVEKFGYKVDLIYADPDRRPQGKRKVNVEEMSPSLEDLLDLFFERKLCGGMLIKLAPVINYLKVEKEYFGNRGKYATQWYSWEFISENGVVKEVLLCIGDQAERYKRKSVLLPAGLELTGSGNEEILEAGWQSYVFEPDKAIIRAGLVQKLGMEIGYQLLDSHLGLLTGTQAVSEDYGRLYRLKELLPYNRKLLQKYLREQEIGELVIKTRGFPETVESLRHNFKLKGKNRMIMLIVRIGEGHQVAVLEKE
ncbi:MAG: class I SAM-dependent methyltransferase [Candidatus Cloacimonetes bacterium]|nr:class I SAM-dependent methyltransferase [Candidatus Cloacimonadota bacterium]